MQPALLCGPIIDLPPLVRFTNNGVRFIHLDSSMIRICLCYRRTLYDKGRPDMVWFLQRHKLIKSITFRVRPLLLRININIMHIFILSRVLLYSHMIWSECDPSECHSIQSSAALKGFGKIQSRWIRQFTSWSLATTISNVGNCEEGYKAA